MEPPVTDFALDPRLAATSAAVADLPLSHVRLAVDCRWPWLVLVPRRAGAVELTDLDQTDRVALVGEIDAAAAAVRAVGWVLDFEVAKLNVGALGNVVPQLHVHVLGRRPGDAAWPGPVWGVGAAEPYPADLLDRALAAARGALA